MTLHLVSRVTPDITMACGFGVVFSSHRVGVASLACDGGANPGSDARVQLCFVSGGGFIRAGVKPLPGRASGVLRAFHHATQEHADALANAVYDALPFLIGHGTIPRTRSWHFTAPAL